MSDVLRELTKYFAEWQQAWNQFWFSPRDPIVLGLIRVLAGSIIFYTHLAWSFGLESFFGSTPLIPENYRATLSEGKGFFWSHFDWIPSELLWPFHFLALGIMALFVVGFKTRITSALTAFFVISYANRATGAQFGLDQINAFLSIYLAIGPSGARFSLDNYLLQRAGGKPPTPSVTANIAARLIQVHMCIVYFFAGTGKLLGESWWDGTAIWGAVANFEYQTLDLTWLATRMSLVNILTYLTLFWEVSYPFLIWPRLTRPIWLLLAFFVHLGIGLAMGMMTFGLIMVVGNLIFLPEELVHKIRFLTKR